MITKDEYVKSLHLVNTYVIENNEHDIRLCKVGSRLRYNNETNKTWVKDKIYLIQNIRIRPNGKHFYHIRTEKGMSWEWYHGTNRFTIVKI